MIEEIGEILIYILCVLVRVCVGQVAGASPGGARSLPAGHPQHSPILINLEKAPSNSSVHKWYWRRAFLTKRSQISDGNYCGGMTIAECSPKLIDRFDL